jgi:hypothetical protein
MNKYMFVMLLFLCTPFFVSAASHEESKKNSLTSPKESRRSNKKKSGMLSPQAKAIQTKLYTGPKGASTWALLNVAGSSVRDALKGLDRGEDDYSDSDKE